MGMEEQFVHVCVLYYSHLCIQDRIGQVFGGKVLKCLRLVVLPVLSTFFVVLYDLLPVYDCPAHFILVCLCDYWCVCLMLSCTSGFWYFF